MIRVTELLLLFAPMTVFVAWRLWAPGKAPSVGMIIGLGVVLALLAGGLIWIRFDDSPPHDSVYMPSHIENGRIIP